MTIWGAGAACILGWAGGLLVDYLADLLPSQSNLAKPLCPACQAPIHLLGYLPWRRPCPNCGRKAGLRDWLAPALLALAAAWTWLNPPAGMGFLLGLSVLVYFALVLVIDIEHRLILHITSLAGALIALAAGFARQGWLVTLVGGLTGLVIMLAIYFLGGLFGRLLGRLRGRAISEVPFGFGDVLLGTIIGLMVGWPEILRSLLFTILAAGLFSLVYLAVMLALRRYRLGSAIPYAPFLILSAIWILYLI